MRIYHDYNNSINYRDGALVFYKGGAHYFKNYYDKIMKCFDYLKDTPMDEIIKYQFLIIRGVKDNFLDVADKDFNIDLNNIAIDKWKFLHDYSKILDADLYCAFEKYIENRGGAM